MNPRDMQALLNSKVWKAIEKTINERVAIRLSYLGGLVIEENSDGTPKFANIHDQSMFIRGALADLDWIKKLPQALAEDNQFNEGEGE